MEEKYQQFKKTIKKGLSRRKIRFNSKTEILRACEISPNTLNKYLPRLLKERILLIPPTFKKFKNKLYYLNPKHILKEEQIRIKQIEIHYQKIIINYKSKENIDLDYNKEQKKLKIVLK